MANLHLTETQVHEVIIRAGEIERRMQAGMDESSDLENVLAAAQEAGLSRDAVLQAIHEHLDLVGAPPKLGDLVFAKSTDGKFYASEIVDLSRTSPRVRFLNGSEASINADDIRPLVMSPGTKVICKWPSWGDWTCTVIRYDASAASVRVSDGWGSEKTFPLAEVQLETKQFEPKKPGQAKQVALQAALALAAGAGIAGSVLTWLLLR